jgi:hypothetical protein
MVAGALHPKLPCGLSSLYFYFQLLSFTACIEQVEEPVNLAVLLVHATMCGFLLKPISIPGRSRSRFLSDSDQDSWRKGSAFLREADQ